MSALLLFEMVIITMIFAFKAVLSFGAQTGILGPGNLQESKLFC